MHKEAQYAVFQQTSACIVNAVQTVHDLLCKEQYNLKHKNLGCDSCLHTADCTTLTMSCCEATRKLPVV